MLAIKDGRDTGKTPKVGAIVVMTGGPFKDYGHVGLVVKVHGETYTVRACNWPKPLAEDTRTFPIPDTGVEYNFIYPTTK